MKKITDDFVKAFDLCIDALSLKELSRRTGIGIYTLRKFATRQTNSIKEETWDKIYPVLKPYLLDIDNGKSEILPRIGPTARKHHDLVDLVSDQKILLDTFGALSRKDQTRWLTELSTMTGDSARAYELGSLSQEENGLLGMFDCLAPEKQQEFLLEIVELATLEVRRIRKNQQ